MGNFLVVINTILNSVTILNRKSCLIMMITISQAMASSSYMQQTTSVSARQPDKFSSRASSALSYQEFLINEASYKFWAIFQLVTVVVLLYSTFAAIYYARYQYLMNLEAGNYDDLLFARHLHYPFYGIPLADMPTFHRMLDTILEIVER